MEGGLGLDGMFGDAGDDDEGVTEVTRQVSQRVGPEASAAPGATSERLRVAEFGAEEFWHGRWDGEGDAHGGGGGNAGLFLAEAGRFSRLLLDKGCADVFALSDDATALPKYAREVVRLTAAGGFCVLVTAWTAERRQERLRLFAGLTHVSTTMVHSHGPAAEHMVVLRREG